MSLMKTVNVKWLARLFKALTISAALLLSLHAASLSQPSQLCILLFQAEADSDSVFLNGPFRLSKTGPQPFPAKRFQISYKVDHFEIKVLDQAFGAKEKPPLQVRAPYLSVEPAGLRFIRVGRRANKMRSYFGKILLASPDRKKLTCRNLVDRQDYVTCVVGSESPPQFPLEALKALSVLIQSSTLRYKPDDQINDTTEKQAYMGADFARSEVVAAVQQTWGQKLVCGEQLVPVYFHSTCAGGTSSSEIFTGKKPALRCDKGVSCHYCNDSPFSKSLSKSLQAVHFKDKVAPELPQIQSRDAAGRPLQISYPNGKTETGYQLWLRIGQQLGWDVAPGTRFELSRGPDGSLKIESTGAGHGVGLCQWGSNGLAKKGWNYQKILQFYFPGSRILQEG